MTNIMKEKPMAAIHERAMTFISKCVEAGQKSVDVYVGFQNMTASSIRNANPLSLRSTAMLWTALLTSCSAPAASDLST